MSSIKLKNIKQTVVGSTPQPLSIGGVAVDNSDEVINIASNGALSLLSGEVVIGGQITSNSGVIAMGNSGGTINGYLFNDSSGISLLDSTGVPKIKVNKSTGEVDIMSRLNLTNGQIKFPATQVPSADPNTLDDYEEGTWTPVNAQNSGQIGTWSTYVGRYTKIGKVVVVTIEITGTGMGYNSTTGYTKFTGLPFTPQGGAGGTWVSANIAGGLCGMALAINTDNALWLTSPQVANVTSHTIWASAMYLVA